METFFRILLLAMVLVLAFIPNSFFGVFFPIVIALPLMALYGYWYWMYFVKMKNIFQIKPELENKVKFNIFCGMTPIDNKDNIIHVQFVVTETSVLLFQRKRSKERTKNNTCKQILEIQVNNINSIEFKRVAGYRYGFVVNYGDNESKSFMSVKIKKHKKEFSKSLGFEYNN